MRKAVLASTIAAALLSPVLLLAQVRQSIAKVPTAQPSPSPSPAAQVPAVVSSSVLVAMNTPALRPERMDFGSLWNGQSARRTLSLRTNALGTVTAELPGGPFRLAEYRELAGSGGASAVVQPGGATNVKNRLTYAENQTGPFRWNLVANTTIELDVVFQPHFDLFTMAAGQKNAVLRVTGPGPKGAWTLNVPLSGFFDGIKINVAMTLAPRELDPISPAATADLVATIVGVDGASPGTLKATKLPRGVSMSPVQVNVPKGQTVQVPLKLSLSWGALATDAVARDGEITFAFPGGSSKAGFSLAGLPPSLSRGFANRTDCGIDSAGASVTVYPTYFVLVARGNNRDLVNNRTVYFDVRSGGKLLGGGILQFAFGTSTKLDQKNWDSRSKNPVNFHSRYADKFYSDSPDYAWVAHHPPSVGCRLLKDGTAMPVD